MINDAVKSKPIKETACNSNEYENQSSDNRRF